ncbi:MAG: single-stranded-DNA-specific exonuclease RecJ [Lachnospiraceae bacterium]|nr:single-stranded-DNA-specific exonuclease RecJ [Lachnospiraceae bacterium]
MKSNWIIYNKKRNIKEISQKFGVTPLTSVILCNRDIYSDEEIKKILSNDISDLNDAKLLPDVDKACEILFKSIKDKKKIRIVGDYDIDGVCATYILYDCIKKFGGDVSFDIPDRINDGYGINISIIDRAIADKIDLIITCDNGIAAGEQITYAKNNGLSVIVTDHHDISTLPQDALAIVNPKRTDVTSPYPFDGICGAVVAWKYMIRFYELYSDKNTIVDDYLEFAMIATIGDVMALINENHIIAKLGLKKILHTNNKGLKRLLEVANYDFANKGISSFHIGFIIGPLINAAGRMDNAALALNLFISDDTNEIDRIAEKLKDLNDDRKNMTENGTKYAIEEIESKYKNDKVFVVYVNGAEEQVAGIIAGRVKEKYNKPTIILTDSKNADEAKASCRSIEAYDIFEALNRHNDMLLKFGGHKLAAGFSIYKLDIEKLRELLNSECNLKEDDFIKKVYIDAEFSPTDVSLDIAEEIESLEPYGQSFNRPQFAVKDIKAHITKVYGSEQNVIKMAFEKEGARAFGVAFTDYKEINDRLSKSEQIDLIYYPKLNEYKGNKNVEISLVEYR